MCVAAETGCKILDDVGGYGPGKSRIVPNPASSDCAQRMGSERSDLPYTKRVLLCRSCDTERMNYVSNSAQFNKCSSNKIIYLVEV